MLQSSLVSTSKSLAKRKKDNKKGEIANIFPYIFVQYQSKQKGMLGRVSFRKNALVVLGPRKTFNSIGLNFTHYILSISYRFLLAHIIFSQVVKKGIGG